MNAPLWIIRIRYALGRWLVAPVVRLPRRMGVIRGQARPIDTAINSMTAPCSDATQLQRQQLEALLRIERLLSRLLAQQEATWTRSR